VSAVKGIVERLGASLRRGPYVWLALILALFLLVLPGLAPLVDDQDQAKTWMALLATGFIAYGALAAVVLVPRVVLARTRATTSKYQIAAMRWSFAGTPFVLGCGTVAPNAKHCHCRHDPPLDDR